MTHKIKKMSGTVLIVEDSRTQAEYLSHILARDWKKVMVAENGRVALDMLAQEKPAIILTDIVMPEMDGFELCRQIRRDPETSGIPVVLVTQLFDPADVLRGLEAGADNFIIKPFEPDFVFLRIAEALHEEKVRHPEHDATPLDVVFMGKHYAIGASKLQILHILLSTYDIAVRKNTELQDAQELLQSLNEQLQGMVEELQVANEDLQTENNSRQRAERELAEANKKLQLMTSITRHDLLNQLAVLQGYLELVQMVSATDAQKAESYIKNSLAAVTKTISTIQFTGDYQTIGVNSPVWNNISRLIAESQKYSNLGHIRIENKIPPSAEVFADPLIEKVIFNLIDNSIRYASTLTTIRFGISREENHTILFCEDDGIGISDNEKERIFSYAYGSNTGMGLFLVREILSITGIRIRETGTYGKGARFEMILPPKNYRET
jgi:two-component system, sensor histidine kinase and response regulator